MTETELPPCSLNPTSWQDAPRWIPLICPSPGALVTAEPAGARSGGNLFALQPIGAAQNDPVALRQRTPDPLFQMPMCE